MTTVVQQQLMTDTSIGVLDDRRPEVCVKEKRHENLELWPFACSSTVCEHPGLFLILEVDVTVLFIKSGN